MIIKSVVEQILFDEFQRQWAQADLHVFVIPGTSGVVPVPADHPRVFKVAGEIQFHEFVQNVHARLVQALREANRHKH